MNKNRFVTMNNALKLDSKNHGFARMVTMIERGGSFEEKWIIDYKDSPNRMPIILTRMFN